MTTKTKTAPARKTAAKKTAASPRTKTKTAASRTSPAAPDLQGRPGELNLGALALAGFLLCVILLASAGVIGRADSEPVLSIAQHLTAQG